MTSSKSSNGIVPHTTTRDTQDSKDSKDSSGEMLVVRSSLNHAASLQNGHDAASEMSTTNGIDNHKSHSPISVHPAERDSDRNMMLELKDGTTYEGFSFGAHKSVAGELVFQTGMVGYPEAVTDPSYRGQILVITFPLVGNYGVPPRETVDDLLSELPAHFESSEIHIAGLVVASYSGEDFSNYLASSSLGTWLKEQNVPAMYGVDTRALTKKIRKQGSMLGKLLLKLSVDKGPLVNGHSTQKPPSTPSWQRSYEHIEWIDPNKSNLVAAGEHFAYCPLSFTIITSNALIQSLAGNPTYIDHDLLQPFNTLLDDQFVFYVLMSASNTTSFGVSSPGVLKFRSSPGTMTFLILLARTTMVSSSLMDQVTQPYLPRLSATSQRPWLKAEPLSLESAWDISSWQEQLVLQH